MDGAENVEVEEYLLRPVNCAIHGADNIGEMAHKTLVSIYSLKPYSVYTLAVLL